MYQPKTIFTRLALDSIIHFLDTKKIMEIPRDLLFKEPMLAERAGCFVSLHKCCGDLRGCIGTIEPAQENLCAEMIENAIGAAFRDSRFSPLKKDELDEIDLSVDVLSIPERITGPGLLDPEKYGVIVSDGLFRRAVLLPNIRSVRTIEEQVRIVKKKADLGGYADEELEFYRFRAKRYY